MFKRILLILLFATVCSLGLTIMILGTGFLAFWLADEPMYIPWPFVWGVVGLTWFVGLAQACGEDL